VSILQRSKQGPKAGLTAAVQSRAPQTWANGAPVPSASGPCQPANFALLRKRLMAWQRPTLLKLLLSDLLARLTSHMIAHHTPPSP
jgi:hypothetical protein